MSQVSLPPNAFKSALAAGRQQIGLWSSLCSNIVAEILAVAGFDWIVVDTEHAPNEIAGVLPLLQAMKGGTAEPVVDPAGCERRVALGFDDLRHEQPQAVVAAGTGKIDNA